MPATEKDLGILLNSRPTMSQQCILVMNEVKISLGERLGRVLPAGQGQFSFVLYAALVRPVVEDCVGLPGCVRL